LVVTLCSVSYQKSEKYRMTKIELSLHRCLQQRALASRLS
jgi:hypothetical protein